MAQIDHEEGNQSVLREVRAYKIISTPLRKKIRRSPAIVSGFREAEGGRADTKVY